MFRSSFFVLNFLLASWLVFIQSCIPTLAIIIRHDVADDRYLTFGRGFRDSICHLNVNPKVPDCMATFVAKRWIITAAHCAELVAARMKKTGRHDIDFRGKLIEVEKVYLHPQYLSTRSVEDVALIKLREKGADARPIPLFTERLIMHEPIIVVGYGDFGTGISGPVANDAKLRAGTNTLDRISDEWLRFRFDAPQDPGVADLEAISGPGDSGGPLFVTRQGRHYIAGISSRQSTAATGGREGLYGVTELYARTATYHSWIVETLRK